MEMDKQRFLKFLISEIERQQKDMYKTNEGKKVVSVLTEIYTLVSDGKFDDRNSRGEEISEEIKRARQDSKNFKRGPTGSYPTRKINGGEVHHEV